MDENYSWQKPYHDAVLETDTERLKQSISYAEWMIDLRLCEKRDMSRDESNQIAKALSALAVLRAERIPTPPGRQTVGLYPRFGPRKSD